MKANEFSAMNPEQLTAKVKELKSELFNLRFQHAINQLDNPGRIETVKRDIARVNTVLRANELKDLKAELFNLRFQLATGQLQNTAALKQCKKDIARVKTVIRQLEMSGKA